MSVGSREPPGVRRLADYRDHYREDAESILDPGALRPVRRASEQRRLDSLVRLLALRPGERVLDAGCGSGWLAWRCRSAGARVWALDLALLGVAQARARFPQVGQYQVGDLYALPFVDLAFDAVVLSEVLEHLEEPERGLAEAGRVLRPGGRLLVSVPYREVIVEHLCIHCNRLTPANAHLHSFDETRLADCLERQGLRVQRTRMLSSKLLELAGFPHRSRGWPFWAWCALDRLANRLTVRPGFLAALATKAG